MRHSQFNTVTIANFSLICTSTFTCDSIRRYPPSPPHTHTHTHTHTHQHIHAYTHAHAHTHKHTLNLLRFNTSRRYPDFVVRTLAMTMTTDGGDEHFTTKQFHYTSWPDHGVPESTAATLMMLRKARHVRVGNDGPMLVHCSAGVGRTGTSPLLYAHVGMRGGHDRIYMSVCLRVCVCVCVCVCVRVLSGIDCIDSTHRTSSLLTHYRHPSGH